LAQVALGNRNYTWLCQYQQYPVMRALRRLSRENMRAHHGATIYCVEVQKETSNGTVAEKECTIDDVPYNILHQKMLLKAANDLNNANILLLQSNRYSSTSDIFRQCI
jgi:hypothetical protein